MRVIVVRKKCHNRALDPCFFYYFETQTKSMEGLSHAQANIFKEVRQKSNSLKKYFAFLLPTNLGFSYNLEKSLSSSSSTTSTLMIMNIVSSSSSSPPSGQCQSVEDAPHQKLIRGDHQTKPETITAPLSFFYCLKVAPLVVRDKS